MLKFVIACAAVVALCGCKDEPSGSVGAEKQQSDETPAKESKKQGWKKDATKDCPTHIRGAKVELEEIDGGYVVTVTSPNASDALRILDNAEYVAGASAHSKPPEDALMFGGATRNRNNNCPIVLEGSIVTFEKIESGARIEVRPTDASKLDELRATAKDKLETLQIMKEAMDSVR